MAEPDTLIDQLYAMTFGKPVPAWQSNKLIRRALIEARRFVLDKSMSAFLADLQLAAFNPRTQCVRPYVFEQFRTSARLPHAVTWVEYDFIAHNIREHELRGAATFELKGGEHEVREGWLLNAFDKDDQVFRAHLFRRSDSLIVCFPLSVFWRTDGGRFDLARPLNPGNRNKDFTIADILLGVHGGNHPPFLTVARGELLTVPSDWYTEEPGIIEISAKNCGIGTGMLRRIWALLATVNDDYRVMH